MCDLIVIPLTIMNMSVQCSSMNVTHVFTFVSCQSFTVESTGVPCGKKNKLISHRKCWDKVRNYLALLDVDRAVVGYFCSSTASVQV